MSIKLRSALKTMGRIFAVSDIHVDFYENMAIVKDWSHDMYGNDALILAGDVTDDILLLEKTLKYLKSVFAELFFVPGNHELWVKSRSEREDRVTSISKFHSILSVCERLGVQTSPKIFQISQDNHVWIVPLFSWYSKPNNFPEDSLHMPSASPENEEMSEKMWMDNELCIWPELDVQIPEYFSKLNDSFVKKYDAPVITFSHFLPRSDLIMPSTEELEAMRDLRKQNGIPEPPEYVIATMKKFNFSRFAGSRNIEKQIRDVGSVIHVYGHQHRNKDTMKDDVRYISHCLAYKRERKAGIVLGMFESCQPKQIWP